MNRRRQTILAGLLCVSTFADLARGDEQAVPLEAIDRHTYSIGYFDVARLDP